MTPAARVLVLGASGRLGGMLQRHWRVGPIAPLWQFRGPSVRPDSLTFSPLDDIPDCGPVEVVLALAGVVPAPGADLALNTALGLAAVRLGVALKARHVLVSSSAAVYGDAPHLQAEDTSPGQPGAYGKAKLAMEAAVLDAAERAGLGATALRIGNVAGADALLGKGEGPRLLDRFAGRQGARRSWIGPRVLAQTLAALAGMGAQRAALPPVLNVAQPGVLAMEDLLSAAAIPFEWREAPAQALACVTLDLTALCTRVPLAPATPAGIVADWRADLAARREGTP